MKIIVCQSAMSPPTGALDRITGEADFFLLLSLGVAYMEGSHSRITVRRKGRLDSDEQIPTPCIPAHGAIRFVLLPFVYLHYLRLVLRSLRQCPESRESAYIGRAWQWTACGLVARCFGRAKRVIYWVGDFYPIAGTLQARIDNRIYQAVERYLVRHADEVWHVTKRIYDAHAWPGGRRWTTKPESILSCLYDAHPDVHALWTSDRLHSLVYVGLVKKGQGLEIILPAIERVRTQFPDVFLDVAGGGPDEAEFRAQAERLGISDRVRFHGYVQDEAELRRIVARAAAGFALYDPATTGHSYYTLASKVYLYVGCGTPVIINEAAGSYDYVMQGKAGVSVVYAVESAAEGIRRLTSDPASLAPCRAAARALAAGFDQEAEELKNAIEAACG